MILPSVHSDVDCLSTCHDTCDAVQSEGETAMRRHCEADCVEEETGVDAEQGLTPSRGVLTLQFFLGQRLVLLHLPPVKSNVIISVHSFHYQANKSIGIFRFID